MVKYVLPHFVLVALIYWLIELLKPKTIGATVITYWKSSIHTFCYITFNLKTSFPFYTFMNKYGIKWEKYQLQSVSLIAAIRIMNFISRTAHCTSHNIIHQKVHGNCQLARHTKKTECRTRHVRYEPFVDSVSRNADNSTISIRTRYGNISSVTASGINETLCIVSLLNWSHYIPQLCIQHGNRWQSIKENVSWQIDLAIWRRSVAFCFLKFISSLFP